MDKSEKLAGAEKLVEIGKQLTGHLELFLGAAKFGPPSADDLAQIRDRIDKAVGEMRAIIDRSKNETQN